MRRFIEKLFFIGRCSYFQLRLLELITHYKFRFKFLFKYKTLDIFYRVAIETISTCNRKCSYCPNSLYSREQKLMDTDLFKKIISDLTLIDYNGTIAPCFYGEPLLDHRLSELVAYTKEKLPKTLFYLYTNGDYLSKDLFLKLISSGVDKFFVSHHENKPPKIFMSWYEKASFSEKRKIIFKKMDENSPLSNRGGAIKVKNNITRIFGRRCKRPSISFTVDVFGESLLCCNDFFGKYSFGNVKEKSVMETWESAAYAKMRKEIVFKHVFPEICKKCLSDL